MSLEIDADLFAEYVPLPSGDPDRFGRRWHLTGAGVENVWDFAPMDLDAPSGRLLLRGTNGTGKTTLLEVLLTYLYDLDANQLRAGRNRNTTLGLLMGGTQPDRKTKKQYGYAWLTFTSPGADQTLSFGVRMQYSDKSSPQVTVYPFVVPGVPGRDLNLRTVDGGALGVDTFREEVQGLGGTVWDRNEHDEYVAHLGNTVLGGASVEQVKAMTARLRIVRNPALLASTGHREAADALRAALPTVDAQVVQDTAKALDASKTTREAYELKLRHADDLTKFADTWANRLATVTVERADQARTAVSELKTARRDLSEARKIETAAHEAVSHVEKEIGSLQSQIDEDRARHDILINSEAYKDGDKISELVGRAASAEELAAAKLSTARSAISALNSAAEDLEKQATRAADELRDQVTAAQAADPHATGATLNVTVGHAPIGEVGSVQLAHLAHVRVDGDAQLVRAASDEWTERAGRAEASADKATLALNDYAGIESAEKLASQAEQDANKLSEDADAAEKRLTKRTQEAADEKSTLMTALNDWARLNVDLTAPHNENPGWGSQDVADLAPIEPGAARHLVESWLTYSRRRASKIAGTHDANAEIHEAAGGQALTDAAELERQAQEFENGKLADLRVCPEFG